MKVLTVRSAILSRQSNVRLLAQSVNDESYQYLQKGKLPMLFFQNSLPRLPIPDLEKTCQRYLDAQRPILTDEEFHTTEHNVQRFRTSGLQLQKILKETDKLNKHTSYISGPWFNMYLKDRAPLPVNYNPLLLMKPDERPEYNDQLIKASNLVISSLRFMKSLKENLLEPEVFHLNPQKSDTDQFRKVVRLVPNFIATYAAYAFKAFPLDMSQYQGLFNASRIPELEKDRIHRVQTSKHLLVMKDGSFYTIDVLDDDGNIREPSYIMTQLKFVLSRNETENKNPIGALTTENRDNWARTRKYFESLSSRNRSNFELIDSAIFCLCLDNTSINEDNPIETIRSFLFDECKNRWYDKSLSVIVNKTTAGINFEHSWGDGVAVLRYFNELYKEISTKPFINPSTQPINIDYEHTIKRLDFDIDARIENDIKIANEKHENIVKSIDMNFLRYGELNKNECKKYKCSPDAMMQLSFQMAYFKQYQKFVGTYESCSTAAFKHGRTETMRPCTTETKEFCELMALHNQRPSNQEMRQKMEKCSIKHNQLTKDAAMGQGFDRHLFGLRYYAELNGMKKDALFEDPAYARINHNIISTSTLSSNALLAGGFGPVVKDGYGIGYNIQDTMLGCVLANYKDENNGKEFLECLKEAYDEIGVILRSVA